MVGEFLAQNLVLFFHWYNRPLTSMNVIASFCAIVNLWTQFDFFAVL